MRGITPSDCDSVDGVARIGVVADTHVGEWTAELPQSVLDAFAGVDLILHAGDITDTSVLDRLATSPDPLLIGHAGLAFNPNMRLIEWQTYVRRRLKLTLLGQNVLAGQADCCDYNPIDRWWGGTHLTNLRLWRWSARGKRLLPPGARPDSSMAVELPRERVRRRPLKLAS